MTNKSELVRKAIQAGDNQKALSIASGFRLGMTKEQRAAIVRAHECYVNPGFYKSIGIDIEKARQEGIIEARRVVGAK